MDEGDADAAELVLVVLRQNLAEIPVHVLRLIQHLLNLTGLTLLRELLLHALEVAQWRHLLPGLGVVHVLQVGLVLLGLVLTGLAQELEDIDALGELPGVVTSGFASSIIL